MGSDRRGSGSSLRLAVVGALVLVAAVGSTATAGSQAETFEGSYTGGIYLRVDSAHLDLDGLGRIDGRTDAAGEASLIVDDLFIDGAADISGTWTLEGSSASGGTMTANGVTGTLAANTVVTGSGTFTGTTVDGRVQGSTTATGQQTFSGATGTAIATPINETDAVDEPITNLLVACRQLLAKWDSELPQKLEARAPGFQVNSLTAYLVLFDIVDFTDASAMSMRLQKLAKRGNSILSGARGGGDGLEAVSSGVELLGDVEWLQADIARAESDCPTDKAFTNILTLIAQDALDAILLGFETDPDRTPLVKDFRKIVRLGQGTGALGSGAKDTARATDLAARIEAQADEAFQRAADGIVVEETSDFAWSELIALAVLGEQQGWSLKTDAGITGADVLTMRGN